MKKLFSMIIILSMLISMISVAGSVSYAAEVTGESKEPFVETAAVSQVLKGITGNTFYKMDGTKVTISSSSMKYNSNTPYILEGSCSDGEDYFFTITYTSSLNYNYGYIIKYDTSEEKWYVSERLPIAHGNDLAYNSRRDLIAISNYLPSIDCVTLINPSDLTLYDQVPLVDDDGDELDFFAIAYDDVNDRYIVSGKYEDKQDGVIYDYVLDGNFKVISKYVRNDGLREDDGADPQYTTQGSDCTADYIMRPYSAHKTNDYNVIAVTDWNGKFVQYVTIPLKYEVEDMFRIGDTYYASFHNKSAGGYLYKISMTSYTIKYNANGGTGTMSDSTGSNGVNSALTANTFKNTGLNFAGWTAHRASDNAWLYVDAEGNNDGWYVEGTQPDGYKKYMYTDKESCGSLSPINGDVITMYAVWKANKYTIAYNKNSGTGTMSSITAYCGEDAILSANTFTRANYDFIGWTAMRKSDSMYLYSSADGASSAWYKSGKQPSGWAKKVLADKGVVRDLCSANNDTVTMYAEWRAITYTVHFEANGGTGTMADGSYQKGTSKALTTNAFKKAGYTFAGWTLSRESDGKLLYKNGSTTVWYTEGTQPEGYVLAVYTDKQKVSALTEVYGDVVTCTAQWTANKYTIAYNKNSGTGTMSSTTAYYNTIITLSANTMTRANYEYMGWEVYRKSDKKYLYVDTDGTTEWYASGKQPTGWTKKILADQAIVFNLTASSGDTITLYASWRAITYTVHFEANGGTGAMADGSYQKGTSKALTTNAFKKAGYTFAGWTLSRESDGKLLYKNGSTTVWYTEGTQPEGYVLAVYTDKQKVSALTEVYGDVVTCTAQWTANKYTISYNKNSGSGSMSSTTAYYDTETTLRKNTFTRSGYAFTGWTAKRKSDSKYLYVGADGTTEWYASGKQPTGWVKYEIADQGSVLNLTATSSDTITLYATWVK